MPLKSGKANSFPLRLPVTMRRELKALAETEGISINQLITVAVAEKIVRHQRLPALDYAADIGSPTVHDPNRLPQ